MIYSNRGGVPTVHLQKTMSTFILFVARCSAKRQWTQERDGLSCLWTKATKRHNSRHTNSGWKALNAKVEKTILTRLRVIYISVELFAKSLVWYESLHRERTVHVDGINRVNDLHGNCTTQRKTNNSMRRALVLFSFCVSPSTWQNVIQWGDSLTFKPVLPLWYNGSYYGSLNGKYRGVVLDESLLVMVIVEPVQ